MDDSLGGEILGRLSPSSLVWLEGVTGLMLAAAPAHHSTRQAAQAVGEGKIRQRAASESCWEESLYFPATGDEDCGI